MGTGQPDLNGSAPQGMPAHGSNKVAWHMAGEHLEMALNGQKVIGDWEVDIGQHVVR